jgi:hypothetical protein
VVGCADPVRECNAAADGISIGIKYIRGELNYLFLREKTCLGGDISLKEQRVAPHLLFPAEGFPFSAPSIPFISNG